MENGEAPAMSRYQAEQNLNDWVVMLDRIYGDTQNYAKSAFEIHAHLTEVTGAFGKHLFKKNDVPRARDFLPKIFAWAVALFRKVKPSDPNLEDIILRKFPTVCSYCLESPCKCWETQKPTIEEAKVRETFYSRAGAQRRSVNDYQMMFRRIYEESWLRKRKDPNTKAIDALRILHTRMIEELAEIAEAIRFYHLYPSNFENELADFIAWWFAIVSVLNRVTDESAAPILAESLLWTAYPGYCIDCQMIPCLCRPGPVRELMSKPAPGDSSRLDGLTLLHNQAAYLGDLNDISSGQKPVPAPMACVRVDVDSFKSINDSFGHNGGDAALRHLAGILSRKVRERDRLYRASGDEFAVLCSDFSVNEAQGMMSRIANELKRDPAIYTDSDGKSHEIKITLSVGIADAPTAANVKEAFDRADKAAYASKKAGKDRISVWDESMLDGDKRE